MHAIKAGEGGVFISAGVETVSRFLGGSSIDNLDLVEISEAFAAQVIPSCRDLGIDLDRLNGTDRTAELTDSDSCPGSRPEPPTARRRDMDHHATPPVLESTPGRPDNRPRHRRRRPGARRYRAATAPLPHRYASARSSPATPTDCAHCTPPRPTSRST